MANVTCRAASRHIFHIFHFFHVFYLLFKYEKIGGRKEKTVCIKWIPIYLIYLCSKPSSYSCIYPFIYPFSLLLSKFSICLSIYLSVSYPLIDPFRKLNGLVSIKYHNLFINLFINRTIDVTIYPHIKSHKSYETCLHLEN